jgi:hypothetical protein
MVAFIRKMSQGAGAAIGYITVGVLMMIWSGVWFYALRDHDVPTGSLQYHVCAGSFLTGLALTGIGLLVGRIAHEGKKADTNTAAVGAPVAGVPMPAAPMAAPVLQAPVMAAPTMMAAGTVPQATRAPVATNANTGG